MNAREREGILIGVGAGLMLIVLLVLQFFVGSNLLKMRTVNSTTTAAVSTISDAYEQVAGANALHILLLDSRNVSGLMSGYERNATLEWTAGPNPINLTASSLPENPRFAAIRTVLNGFMGQFDNFSLANESQTLQPKKPIG